MQLVQCARRYPSGPRRYPCCHHLHRPLCGHRSGYSDRMGVPNYPVIYMPHPLSTCPDAELQEHACRVAGQVVQILLTARVE